MTASSSARRQTIDIQRTQLLRRLHAEAHKRGISHELLSANGCAVFSVRSLKELTVAQLRQYIDELTRAASPRPRVAPAGKRRPEGVAWLPTPRQRRFIARLLDQLFASHPDPADTAVRFTVRRIGPGLGAIEGPVTPANAGAAIAAAVTTGRAAGQLIKVLIGELKKRGQWIERRVPMK